VLAALAALESPQPPTPQQQQQQQPEALAVKTGGKKKKHNKKNKKGSGVDVESAKQQQQQQQQAATLSAQTAQMTAAKLTVQSPTVFPETAPHPFLAVKAAVLTSPCAAAAARGGKQPLQQCAAPSRKTTRHSESSLSSVGSIVTPAISASAITTAISLSTAAGSEGGVSPHSSAGSKVGWVGAARQQGLQHPLCTLLVWLQSSNTCSWPPQLLNGVHMWALAGRAAAV
jgi:hypothetical protein